MQQYFSTEQTASLIKKLNVTYSPFQQWELRKARKEHLDIFGVAIKDGEEYYRLRVDQHLSNDLKLSVVSMDRFLFILFTPRPLWEKNSEEIISDRQEQVRNIIGKLRK